MQHVVNKYKMYVLKSPIPSRIKSRTNIVTVKSRRTRSNLPCAETCATSARGAMLMKVNALAGRRAALTETAIDDGNVLAETSPAVAPTSEKHPACRWRPPQETGDKFRQDSLIDCIRARKRERNYRNSNLQRRDRMGRGETIRENHIEPQHRRLLNAAARARLILSAVGVPSRKRGCHRSTAIDIIAIVANVATCVRGTRCRTSAVR